MWCGSAPEYHTGRRTAFCVVSFTGRRTRSQKHKVVSIFQHLHIIHFFKDSRGPEVSPNLRPHRENCILCTPNDTMKNNITDAFSPMSPTTTGLRYLVKNVSMVSYSGTARVLWFRCR